MTHLDEALSFEVSSGNRGKSILFWYTGNNVLEDYSV
jgi:hypothetical protein